MDLKKLILAVLLTVCLFWIPFAAIVFGADKSITVSWTMPPESPAPTGYRLYQSDAIDMLSRQMILQVDDGSFPQTKTTTVIVPENGGTIYFGMTAYNTAGESELSEIVAKTFDTEQKPYRPMSFTIDIDEAGNVTVRGE